MSDTSEKEEKPYTLKELQEKNIKCSDKVLSDLKYAFSSDYTDEEACRYARISKDSYYRWRNESDDFCHEMDVAKDFVFKMAKDLLKNKVAEGDHDAAKWLLERRKKREYSLRQELTGGDGTPLVMKWEK